MNSIIITPKSCHYKSVRYTVGHLRTLQLLTSIVNLRMKMFQDFQVKYSFVGKIE